MNVYRRLQTRQAFFPRILRISTQHSTLKTSTDVYRQVSMNVYRQTSLNVYRRLQTPL